MRTHRSRKETVSEVLSLRAVTNATTRTRDEAAPPPVEASPEQAREAEEIVAGIVDPNLRESVAKAIKASLARAPHDRPEGEQVRRHGVELRLISILVVKLHTCGVALLFVTRQSIQ